MILIISTAWPWVKGRNWNYHWKLIMSWVRDISDREERSVFLSWVRALCYVRLCWHVIHAVISWGGVMTFFVSDHVCYQISYFDPVPYAASLEEWQSASCSITNRKGKAECSFHQSCLGVSDFNSMVLCNGLSPSLRVITIFPKARCLKPCISGNLEHEVDNCSTLIELHGCGWASRCSGWTRQCRQRNIGEEVSSQRFVSHHLFLSDLRCAYLQT